MSRRTLVTHLLQLTEINRYLVLWLQISHHTDSLHLESVGCFSKHHSNCVILVGIPDVQTFGIYWESPTYWCKVAQRESLKILLSFTAGLPFQAVTAGTVFGQRALASVCEDGEANPLCCLKTFNFFHIQLLPSWEEFLSWLVLKSFQIAINSLMFISKYDRFH